LGIGYWVLGVGFGVLGLGFVVAVLIIILVLIALEDFNGNFFFCLDTKETKNQV
jgi:hypothetical protein